MLINKYLPKEILSATYTKHGGEVVMKMSNGQNTVETKRKCTMIKNSGIVRTCPITNKKIRRNDTCVYVKIGRAGYGSYWFHPSIIGEIVVEEEKPTSSLQQEVKRFIEGCSNTVKFLDTQSMDLKKELDVVKKKRSVIGKKMSRAYALLEVL